MKIHKVPWGRAVEELKKIRETARRMEAVVRGDGSGIAYLDRLEPVYVTREMHEAVQAVASEMPDGVMQRSDLLIPSGFALFDAPRDEELRGVLWHVDGDPATAPRVSIELLTRPDPEDAEQSLFMLEAGAWTFGASSRQWEPDDTSIAPTRWHRHVRALWAFMRSRVAETRKRGVDPITARKVGARSYVPTVLVVTLRRPVNASPAESAGVEWACRWIVRGHWRSQEHLGHEPVYIHPYLKGPGDKPLRIHRGRAFAVVR